MLNWIEKQRELLNQERATERDQLNDRINSLTAKECSDLGITLLHLEVESVRTGLYGRSCFCIQRRDKLEFPVHSFKVGDEVCLYSSKQNTAAEDTKINGIISKISSTIIEFVSEGGDDDILEYPLRLDMLSSEATHKKMVSALDDLIEQSDNSTWPLGRILFDNAFVGYTQPISIVPFNQHLNASQVMSHE